MHGLIAPTINVLILTAVLAYYLRGPFKAFVSGRHVYLRDELARVHTQLSQAQARYSEFDAKLNAIDAELNALREQVRQDAEQMKIKIINEGRRLADSIRVSAKMSATSMYTDLKNQLRAEFGQQVLTRAEAIIRERLTGDDRVRIRREFSKQVETIQ